MPAVSVENLDKTNGAVSSSKEASTIETKKSQDSIKDTTTPKQLLSQSTSTASSEEKASISEVAAALSGNETSLELKNCKLISEEKGANSMSFTEYSDSKSKAFVKK